MFLLAMLLAIPLTIIIYSVYHKIFNMVYFGFMPLIKEIVVMFLISTFITGAIIGIF